MAGPPAASVEAPPTPVGCEVRCTSRSLWWLRRPVLIVLAALVSSTAHGYGEPDGSGRPSRKERLVLTLTNQIRQAPHDWPGWDTSLAPGTPLNAVGGHGSLFESARFHADDMATNQFFAHESSDGTPFGDRINRFFSGGGAAENIYAATFDDPFSAMDGWMNSDTGHRENILRPGWTWLGVGYARGAGRHYYVQNFGETRSAAIPMIPAAASREIPVGKLELIANYFDANRKNADTVQAVVGATVHDLPRTSGQPANGTHRLTIDRPSSCEKLVFKASSSAGTARYPSSGAFLVGAGCSGEYTAQGGAADPSGAATTGPTIIDAQDGGGCRCVSAPPGPGVGLVLLGLLGLLIRRRR